MDSVFGIGTPELLLIIILATMIMGPRRMRDAARTLGRLTAQLQQVARGFTRQLNAELDDATRADMKQAIDEVASLRSQLADLRGEMQRVTRDGNKAVREATGEAQKAVRESAMREIPQETENTIRPPLPNPVDVPDDPDQ